MPLDMYAENLIRHYETPHNKGKLKSYTIKMHEDNPTCGDEIDVYLLVKNDKIEDISFDGTGCAISIGTTSMLTDYVKGKKLSEIDKIDLKKLLDIIGIEPGPARLHCATLSLKALKEAKAQIKKEKPGAEIKDL